MKPRRPPFTSGQYYHLYNRGTDRVSIFQNHKNYIFVTRKLKQYLRELDLSIIAYCLMPNHYHLLVRQNGQQRAGLLPQRIFNSYTKAYNKQMERTGTLFESPYQADLIEDEGHLVHLCRYIHANSVKDNIAQNLERWQYSNYLEWVEKRSETLIDRDFIKSHFLTPAHYQVFVQAYLDDLRKN